MIRGRATALEIQCDVQAALGHEPVDLLLKNCKMVNVYSREIHDSDIAIYRGRIVAIREGFFSGRATNILDLNGSFAAPALVDSYFADDGTIPPASVVRGTGLAVNASEYSNRMLRDHEIAAEFSQVKRAVRIGKTVFLDESIGAAKLAQLLSDICASGIDYSNLCFAASNPSSADKAAHPINLALQSGFSAPEAFQIAALNPATHFCIDDLTGSLAPGRRADILVFDSLEKFRPARMIRSGDQVQQI
jgi:adenine deaminase